YRRPRCARLVVPAWPGGAAADLLASEVREVDALVDRRADLRIGPGTDEAAALGLLQPVRVVRIVPGQPVLHGGQVPLVETVSVRDVVAAVALGRRIREVAQVGEVGRRDVARL